MESLQSLIERGRVVDCTAVVRNNVTCPYISKIVADRVVFTSPVFDDRIYVKDDKGNLCLPEGVTPLAETQRLLRSFIVFAQGAPEGMTSMAFTHTYWDTRRGRFMDWRCEAVTYVDSPSGQRVLMFREADKEVS